MAKTRIVIEADNKASKEIDKLKKQLHSLKNEQNTLGGLVKALGEIPAPAALAAGALAGVAKFAQEAYQKFLEQSKVEQTLTATIKSLTGGYDILSQKLFSVANEIQELTNIDDTNILKGLTRLAEVGTNDLPRAAQSIADLSIVMGSTEKASEALAVAFTNPERGLKQLTQVGIQFSEAQKEQIKTLVESGKASEAQAMILAQVEARYKGIAQEVGKSPQGQVQRLQNAIDDFMVSFGRWVDDLGIISVTISGIASLLEVTSKAMDNAVSSSQNTRAARDALYAISTGAQIAQRDLERLAQLNEEVLRQVLEENSAQIKSYRFQLEELENQVTTIFEEYGARNLSELPASVQLSTKAIIDQRDYVRQLLETENQRLDRVMRQTKQYQEQAKLAEEAERKRREDEEAEKRRREAWERQRAQNENLLRSLESQFIKQTEIEKVVKSIAEIEGLLAQRGLTRREIERAENLKNILFLEKERLENAQRLLEIEANKTEIQKQIEEIFSEAEKRERNRLEFLERYNKAKEEGDEKTLLALDKINAQYDYLQLKTQDIADEWSHVRDEIERTTKPLDLILGITSNFGKVFDEIANQRVSALQKELEAVKGNLAGELKLRKDLGMETAQYEIDRQNQILEAEKKLEYERRKSARESAILRKVIDFATASIAGSKAIIEAIATPPAPNIVLGSLTGALVAAQLAAITATPIPELAEGGIVKATAGGRIVKVAEAGKDEAIIPLDKAKLGRNINITIGTLIGAPTRETVLTLKRELEKIEKERL